jgi:hypothetical protein
VAFAPFADSQKRPVAVEMGIVWRAQQYRSPAAQRLEAAIIQHARRLGKAYSPRPKA